MGARSQGPAGAVRTRLRVSPGLRWFDNTRQSSPAARLPPSRAPFSLIHIRPIVHTHTPAPALVPPADDEYAGYTKVGRRARSKYRVAGSYGARGASGGRVPRERALVPVGAALRPWRRE